MTDNSGTLAKTLKQARMSRGVTLLGLARETGISPSHLGRIERGERNPSGHVLRKLSAPLGFEEPTLLALAGYMATPAKERKNGHLDPYVASVLSQEPVRVQRMVVSILSIFKTLVGPGEPRAQ